MLNGTWKQVKANLSEDQYKKVLQDQRQWASQGRDAACQLVCGIHANGGSLYQGHARSYRSIGSSCVSAPYLAATFEMRNATIAVSVQDKIALSRMPLEGKIPAPLRARAQWAKAGLP